MFQDGFSRVETAMTLGGRGQLVMEPTTSWRFRAVPHSVMAWEGCRPGGISGISDDGWRGPSQPKLASRSDLRNLVLPATRLAVGYSQLG